MIEKILDETLKNIVDNKEKKKIIMEQQEQRQKLSS